jgi:hypothetical protein
MNKPTLTSAHPWRNVLAFAALIVLMALIAPGCASSPEDRIYRADLAVGAAADGVRIAIETKAITDPTAIASAAYAVNLANDAMIKVHAARLAGDATGVDFWLRQALDAIANAPKPPGKQ